MINFLHVLGKQALHRERASNALIDAQVTKISVSHYLAQESESVRASTMAYCGRTIGSLPHKFSCLWRYFKVKDFSSLDEVIIKCAVFQDRNPRIQLDVSKKAVQHKLLPAKEMF